MFFSLLFSEASHAKETGSHSEDRQPEKVEGQGHIRQFVICEKNNEYLLYFNGRYCRSSSSDSNARIKDFHIVCFILDLAKEEHIRLQIQNNYNVI